MNEDIESWLGEAWCPLLGGFPKLEEPATTPAMQCVSLIMEAREMWGLVQEGIENRFGIKLWPGFQFSVRSGEEHFISSYPPPEVVERASGFPAAVLQAARVLFGAQDLLFLSHFFGPDPVMAPYGDGAILSSPSNSQGVIEAALIMARKLPEVGEDVPDFLIIALLAVKEAYTALRQILETGATSDILTDQANGGDGIIRKTDPLQNAIILLKWTKERKAQTQIEELTPLAEKGKQAREGEQASGKVMADARWQARNRELEKLTAIARERRNLGCPFNHTEMARELFDGEDNDGNRLVTRKDISRDVLKKSLVPVAEEFNRVFGKPGVRKQVQPLDRICRDCELADSRCCF